MKANIVPFKNAAVDDLFIEAKLLSRYQVFRKIGAVSAKVYGSEVILTFSKTNNIIVVTESLMSELAKDCQFTGIANAQAACGFSVPEEVLIKNHHGFAEYAATQVHFGRVPVDKNEKVINLSHLFNFDNVTVATLNI